MPKDRGAQQGDVDGPLECSLALGLVAAETCGRVALQQASGSFPWIGVDDPSDLPRLQAKHTAKRERAPTFSWVDLKNSLELTTHVTLCKSYLHEFDDANTKVGAERHPKKTEVI